MRPIDAEAYKSYIRKTYCQYCDGCFDEWRHDDCWQWYAIKTLEAIPTIEAKPVVHAHWEEVSGGRIICTNCGNYPLYDYFGRINLSRCCPTCGALMSNGGHWLFRKAEEYLKENNCGAQMDELVSNTDKLNSSEKPNSWVVVEENATTTNNTQKVSVDNEQ